MGHLVIKPYSAKKVGWICNQCPDGHLHSWSASVQNRTNGTGCPQCSGRKVCKHNSLATKDPAVAAQWDYDANDSTPDSKMAQSNQPAGWHCDTCGHKWRATIHARAGKRKSGCPLCARKLMSKKRIQHPTIAEDPVLLAQWDHARNAEQGHFPDKVTLRSSKQIFWLCNKCPAGQQHSWSAPPHLRSSRIKPGCPFCAGKAACQCNSLQALHPDTAAEWDYAKNQSQPSDYTTGSHYMAWWYTPERGSWQQTINSRTFVANRRSACAN